MKKPATRSNSFLKVGIGFIILFLLNIAGSFLFTRLDLTTEKRHSLTPETVQMIEDLDDVVFIRVYLEGEFPADFKRLRSAVKERLDELKAYAGKKIQYEFINPSENPDQKTRQQTWQRLVERGLEPTEITIQGKDALERKIIFPGAIMSYRGKEVALQILRSQETAPGPETMNSSINNLEYNIANNIRRLTEKTSKRVGILAGQGELGEQDIADFKKAASDLYTVEEVRIDSQVSALKNFDCLIIAKPDSQFTEKNKFIIDQFIMKGGTVLWCVDGISANMDSLAGTSKQEVLGMSQNINLNDMLFTYGARIESNLIIDRSCAPIALKVGQFGDQPNYKLFPWYFHPVLISNGKHPITVNIDPVVTQFVSKVDTVGFPFIKKTVLLSTSENSIIQRAPVRINLGIVGLKLDFKRAGSGPQPVAVLLEGKFKSAYPPERIDGRITSSKMINYQKEAIKPTKMIVIGDGDVIRNPVDKGRNLFYPLGYDKNLKRKVYGNREFLLNSLNYLLDDSGLIAVRSREIKLRKLNEEKLLNERTRWQVINVVTPLVLVIAMGVILFFIRKKKYA
ncbi:MAG: gliding motility-associated ABC transporter substrate-binding protein GldG [Bacteroidota bacterium]